MSCLRARATPSWTPRLSASEQQLGRGLALEIVEIDQRTVAAAIARLVVFLVRVVVCLRIVAADLGLGPGLDDRRGDRGGHGADPDLDLDAGPGLVPDLGPDSDLGHALGLDHDCLGPGRLDRALDLAPAPDRAAGRPAHARCAVRRHCRRWPRAAMTRRARPAAADQKAGGPVPFAHLQTQLPVQLALPGHAGFADAALDGRLRGRESPPSLVSFSDTGNPRWAPLELKEGRISEKRAEQIAAGAGV